eukprot:15462146-Alexandrium_andersonii.AAC.1
MCTCSALWLRKCEPDSTIIVKYRQATVGPRPASSSLTAQCQGPNTHAPRHFGKEYVVIHGGATCVRLRAVATGRHPQE